MLGQLQFMIFLLLSLVLFGIEVWAVVDAARRRPAAFVGAGKRTKGFWLILLGVAAAVGFLGIPAAGPGGGPGLFLMFLAVVPAGIYLSDVRPAVGGPSRGGGSW